MIVSAASRMFSAISFGVFCRDAPSTRAIIRSTKVSPGFVVICTTIRSESTLVPPVTATAVAAGLADDRRGLAGDRRLVDAGDALDDVAVAGDDLAGLDDDDVAERQLRRRRPTPHAAGLARRQSISRRATVSVLALRSVVGLGLAAALGDRLGEVGEEHGEPQPDGDRPGEHRLASAMASTVVNTAPTSTTNMTGLRHQRARVELAQGVRQRRRAAAAGRAGRATVCRGRSAASAGGGSVVTAIVVHRVSVTLPRADRARAPGSR